MNSQLSKLITQFQSASERVAQMERDYSDDEWQQKPGPERWSAIECIWHLNRTSEEMLPRVRKAMKAIESMPKQDGKYSLDLMGWFLVMSLSTRGRFSKFKTTAGFVPKSTMDIPTVLGRFRELQAEMLAELRDSDGLQLGAGKVQSAFHAGVYYNAFSAFRILAVHQHRHLDQAVRAAKQSGNR